MTPEFKAKMIADMMLAPEAYVIGYLEGAIHQSSVNIFGPERTLEMLREVLEVYREAKEKRP